MRIIAYFGVCIVDLTARRTFKRVERECSWVWVCASFVATSLRYISTYTTYTKLSEWRKQTAAHGEAQVQRRDICRDLSDGIRLRCATNRSWSQRDEVKRYTEQCVSPSPSRWRKCPVNVFVCLIHCFNTRATHSNHLQIHFPAPVSDLSRFRDSRVWFFLCVCELFLDASQCCIEAAIESIERPLSSSCCVNVTYGISNSSSSTTTIT